MHEGMKSPLIYIRVNKAMTPLSGEFKSIVLNK